MAKMGYHGVLSVVRDERSRATDKHYALACQALEWGLEDARTIMALELYLQEGGESVIKDFLQALGNRVASTNGAGFLSGTLRAANELGRELTNKETTRC